MRAMECPSIILSLIAGLDPAIQTASTFGMEKHWVYILASKRNGTLYVGVTRNLPKRIFEHKEGITGGFTTRYGVTRLVFAEPHDTAVAAIQREKNIKHWSRRWKLQLIERDNPDWDDLTDHIV